MKKIHSAGKFRWTCRLANQGRQVGRQVMVGGGVLLITFFNLLLYLPGHAGATPTHMMVFWDPAFGSTPSGWTTLTTFNGDFPRGDTVANYGTTGGSGAPYTPTINTVTVGGPSATIPSPGTGSNSASDTHTHPAPTVTVGSDSNGDIPAYRSLELMEYTTGIPTFLPGGAIVMFDTNGSIPSSGFTRISAQDNLMIQVNSSVTTGGSDTETNSVSVGALSARTDVVAQAKQQGNATQAAATNHTHAAAASGNTTATSTLPPYVQPQLAQANADTSTIPANTVVMFDGDPGTGWQVVSGTGGAYNQQFLRPAATASLTSQGATTHTPPSYIATSGADQTAGFNAKSNGSGSGSANATHTHQITVIFNSVSNLPPYFNVVIAQKITFSLQAYRWYVESGSQDVTDPWPSGSLDLAQNTMLPAIPAPYNPPDSVAGTQLRLRVQILVSGQALPASNTQFKLQYKQDTDSTCTTGSWTDVATGNVWSYGANAVTDGTTLTTSRLTPTSSVMEIFSKSATSGTNPNAISTGQTAEYDWLIKDASAAGGSQYSFRVVESSGNPLSTYSQCPTVVTAAQVNQDMRHGEFFQDGVDQGFEWAN